MCAENNRCLTFSSSTELVRVDPHTLVYAVADGNYSVIHFMDGTKYVLSLQLGQMEERLSSILSDDDRRFVRVGKSLIINVDHVLYINFVRKKLVLSDAHTFRHGMIEYEFRSLSSNTQITRYKSVLFTAFYKLNYKAMRVKKNGRFDDL